jgi:hypothetical protein
MTFVLRAKHWQIFLILIGFLYLNSFVAHISELVDDVTYLLYFTLQIGWMLSLGFELNKRSTPERNFGLILAIGLITIAMAFIFRLSMDESQFLLFIQNHGHYVWLGMCLFLATSVIVISAFSAKALKLIETSGEVDINDYFTDFLAILFWPIGIWFIQPRINKI